jgi:eukaryotic-like serine/threonine-protein kinase
MASSPELPNVGDAVAGRFELRRVLGEGGMGIVYEAFDRRRERPCAIKVLFPHYCDQPQIVARFDREAKITATLKGPNVARVYEVGALPTGLRFIAMELLVGRDLSAELHERRRLPIATAVDIVMQVAGAMEEAHDAGVVHRDLKPENLFLVAGEEGPVVKVLDFGISRLTHGNEQLTADFTQLGTARYMSPEQIEAASRVDKRTDVWSLGVVLYEMLVGRAPFEGEGTGVLVSIATRPVPAPSSFVDDLPPDLEAVVMRALEKAPEARFQTMRDFSAALAPWARPGQAPPRRSRVRPLLFGAAAVTVVGAAALGARSLLHHEPTVPPPPSASAPVEHVPSAASAAARPSTAPSTRRAPASRGLRDGGAPSVPRNTRRP